MNPVRKQQELREALDRVKILDNDFPIVARSSSGKMGPNEVDLTADKCVA